MILEVFLKAPNGELPTTTDQMHRIVYSKKLKRSIVIKDKKVQEARNTLKAMLLNSINVDGDVVFKKPAAVKMREVWIFPYRKKDKKEAVKGDLVARITKPDLDNLHKALGDVMTEVGIWDDDSQIVSLQIEKYFGDTPGIYLKVESLPESDIKDINKVINKTLNKKK